MVHLCRCGEGFDTKEEKLAHLPKCAESYRGNSIERMKGNALKRMIRSRLIAKGKYTEQAVETVFNAVTDNGKDLSEIEVVSDPAKVAELNSILSDMLAGGVSE